MLAYPTGLEFTLWSLCMQEVKALARLYICAGSFEPWLLADQNSCVLYIKEAAMADYKLAFFLT